MNHPFQAGGALLADSPVYVVRVADHEAVAHLRNMDYLLVIESRQQGKTSLINHLMCHPTLSDVAFAYADVTTPDRSTEAAWYQTLCPRILRQLRSFIPRDQWPAIPSTSTGWRDFLCDVATSATDAHRRVVIALDEIGAVTFPGVTEFFSVLRDVYNSRQAETEFKQLTFLLAGAFHPRDLIEDDKISPFNIAQRVRLADFALAQVRELVDKGNWSDEQATVLVERIHYWTDGQPYLTQLLCSYLGPDAMSADVDAGVERLRREDENHLPPILKRLNSDGKLRGYVERMLAGEQIKFYPRENRRQAQLELLGVIKEGSEGFCVVRNRIYERVLVGMSGERSGSPTPEHALHPELNDVLTRRTLALFIGADLPREVTGLPSRVDLARDLARRKGLDESLSLAEVAQRVSQAGNRWEFTAFIRDALDTTGKSPQPFHQHVVALVKEYQIETIITTAYDNLLELAFQEAGVAINHFVRGSDVSFINPERPTLIKLYGDAQQPDTLVVTADDHYGLWRDRDKEDLLDEVRAVLRKQTILFLGYNLVDPDFNLLWREVLDRAERFARTAYAVWPGLPEADVRMWRGRGIVILDVDPLGILSDWKGTTLEDQLELSTNDTVPTKEILYLDTTATLFAQWLADYTRMVPYRNFPTEKGRLVLQSTRPAMSIQAPISLTMDTLHVIPKEGEDAEIAWPVGAAIAFRVIPLSSERVEVQAECHHTAVEGYFRELLAEIKQRWPVRKKEAAPISEVSPVPHHRLEPTTVPPVPQSSIGGDNMDHKRGLAQLRECLEHRAPDTLVEFNTLEERFHKNERAERLFGSSENTRNEHSQIIYALNELALKHCGISFNDLCLGKQPVPGTRPTPDDHEIVERLRRIEDKLDQSRAEDRQAVAQIRDALAHNQVEQAEATQMVAELRAWAQTVQQAGLPLNPELRTALDALSQHTGSAYQYLQLAVPIVPGILSYNVELGSQHQVDLKTIWERIRARLGKVTRPSSLADALVITMDHDGRPHKAGPAQWWVRLRIENKRPVRGLLGRVYDVRRFTDPNDQYGVSLSEFHASILSWGLGESGLFAPIPVQTGDVHYLDLAWRAHGDPPIPADELRVASALDQGQRNTKLPDWGMRQDFIRLKPGAYRLVVRILAEGYDTPLDLAYRLRWPGSGREDDIQLIEIPSVDSGPDKKGDGVPTGPQPLHGTGHHWTVLVGVNEYEDKANYGRLHVCVKDVHAVHEQLIAGGFDSARIRLLTDQTGELPTKANILTALKAVADATEPDDLLLFYYSGHGDEEGGESYLVARDGRRLVLGDTAIPLARVREIVEGASARAKVIVLDACHSGADIGGKGSKPMSEEFIRRVFEQAEGLAILASCKQGQVSYEWQAQERSAFTHFLLEALVGQADRDEKGFVTVQDANRHVTNGVKLWASQRNLSQTPTLQYTVAGDIILVRYQ